MIMEIFSHVFMINNKSFYFIGAVKPFMYGRKNFDGKSEYGWLKLGFECDCNNGHPKSDRKRQVLLWLQKLDGEIFFEKQT